MNMKIIQSVHEKQKFKSLSMHTISKRNKQLIINNLLLNLFNSSNLLVIVQQFIEQELLSFDVNKNSKFMCNFM